MLAFAAATAKGLTEQEMNVIRVFRASTPSVASLMATDDGYQRRQNFNSAFQAAAD